MKKLYAFTLVAFVVTACSKDAFKSYDRRIIGTWTITDVNKIGIGGGDLSSLPFKEGSFTFKNDGTLTYTNSTGTFNGTWDIQNKTINDETYHTLQITAVNFTTQQVLGEYYDEVDFVGTNHIKARINNNYRTYVTHLRR